MALALLNEIEFAMKFWQKQKLKAVCFHICFEKGVDILEIWLVVQHPAAAV
jgi:hypothetical protein